MFAMLNVIWKRYSGISDPRFVLHPQQALLPGDCELQQLLHTFQLLGTPNENTWPGVTKLKDWHEFPQVRLVRSPAQLPQHCMHLHAEPDAVVHFLSVFLSLMPEMASSTWPLQ